MEDAHGNRLVQLQILHRHGARSPEFGRNFPSICGSAAFRTFLHFRHQPTSTTPPLHPTNPKQFSSTSEASCYKGQLTPLGAAQMYALGARLRARYSSFLPSNFDPSLVALRSTAMHRTVQSLLATLSGLFPAPSAAFTDFYPVEIEVRSWEHENMIAARRRCNKLFDLQLAAHAGFAFPDALHTAATDWLSPRVDGASTDSRRTLALRDIAIAMRENGCEPQPWEQVAEIPAMAQIAKIYGRDSWALGLGRFVEELLQQVEHHATTPWRIKIYSAHDTTLLPILGLFENGAHRGVPDFAADLVVETWVPPDNDEPKVRLKYQGQDVQISGCEQFGPLCPLSIVREAVARHIPDDIDRACGGTLEERRRRSKQTLTGDQGAPATAAAEGTTF